MTLTPNLKSQYSTEQFSAREAQELAHVYSFGPVVFQVARLLVKYGILDMLGNAKNGMTESEIAEKAHLSRYAAKCLLESALTMHVVLIDTDSDRYTLAKTGWFLLNDEMIRTDIDFNHDVNYLGWFHLDEALEQGKPAGLKHFGNWQTIYEGLSSLPEQVQKSWFGFDHYYSDHSFDEALELISGYAGVSSATIRILDVGGNTGRFALKAVAANPNIHVTVCDLPQQLELMRKAIAGKSGAERIDAMPMNLLDKAQDFPTGKKYNVIWMSQFLDCFGEDEIISILSRAAKILTPDARIFIMETLWDRQLYAPAAFCLTQTSLYFTALANGNSKMYNTDDMTRLIHTAGLEIETIHDNLGQGGHSILICK